MEILSLQSILMFLSSTFTLGSIRVVGWEIPFVGFGIVAWFVLFILRTTALCYSLFRRYIKSYPVSKAAKKRVQENGVTILKPLKGVDKDLKRNLESFFKLDYPKYEILFSIDNPKDTAGAVVNELIAKYPNIDARLVIAKPNNLKNPKISNVITAYHESKYPYIWQSDSNVIVTPQTLTNLVYTLDDDVGLVHQVPLTMNPENLVSKMEMCYISTWHGTMYLFLNLINTPCAVGKSLLCRKKDLDDLGGLEYYSDYLAEDYFLVQDFYNKGWKLRMSADPSFQNLCKLNLGEYWFRQVRWTRLRYSFTPLSTYLELFTNSVANGLFSSHGMSLLLGINPFYFLVFHFLFWMLEDFIIAVGLYGFHPLHIISFFPAWFFREVLAVPLACYASLSDSVTWRGNTYRLLKDSKIDSDKPHSN